METSTSTVANTSASAASATSDLNGMAVLIACKQVATIRTFTTSHQTMSTVSTFMSPQHILFC